MTLAVATMPPRRALILESCRSSFAAPCSIKPNRASAGQTELAKVWQNLYRARSAPLWERLYGRAKPGGTPCPPDGCSAGAEGRSWGRLGASWPGRCKNWPSAASGLSLMNGRPGGLILTIRACSAAVSAGSWPLLVVPVPVALHPLVRQLRCWPPQPDLARQLWRHARDEADQAAAGAAPYGAYGLGHRIRLRHQCTFLPALRALGALHAGLGPVILEAPRGTGFAHAGPVLIAVILGRTGAEPRAPAPPLAGRAPQDNRAILGQLVRPRVGAPRGRVVVRGSAAS
jgi:hypothetical protein